MLQKTLSKTPKCELNCPIFVLFRSAEMHREACHAMLFFLTSKTRSLHHSTKDTVKPRINEPTNLRTSSPVNSCRFRYTLHKNMLWLKLQSRFMFYQIESNMWCIYCICLQYAQGLTLFKLYSGTPLKRPLTGHRNLAVLTGWPY